MQTVDIKTSLKLVLGVRNSIETGGRNNLIWLKKTVQIT